MVVNVVLPPPKKGTAVVFHFDLQSAVCMNGVLMARGPVDVAVVPVDVVSGDGKSGSTDTGGL